MILAMFNCFFVPIELSMGIKVFHDGMIQPIQRANYIIEAIFAIDILTNFFRSYVSEKTGLEVKKNKKIVKMYLRTYFLIDLVACLPIQEIVMALKPGME